MAEAQEEDQQQENTPPGSTQKPVSLPQPDKDADLSASAEEGQKVAAANTDSVSLSAEDDSGKAILPQLTGDDDALDSGAQENKEKSLDLPKLDGLSVSDGATVDKPEIVLKSEKLSEEAESHETEIKKVVAGDTPYTSAKTFEELNLSESLLRGLYSEMKFEKPSRIQAETLPMILTPPHVNLIAQAHNGSGKTTCFVLGMLGRVDAQLQAPQALCVCPTRELAIQNEEVLLKMGKYTGITSVCAIPSDSGGGYLSTRRDPIVDQVVIGTPGTLKRWMTKDKLLSTKHIKILVFDEADHMLAQDGFQDDSMRILRDIQKNRGSCQPTEDFWTARSNFGTLWTAKR
ncbi:hypothetical protein O6H91_08G109400 [Diphasiastrum complanatum]|uniref:Uncharacterized protein n=1 Tax=Diphasiastrum complanatum TaxID=34168 RepID=A0ACC2D0W4_DIPCM|nr:hypothetical protein O6H91_08G109400 [Diphasiastrum complanatum]